MTTSGYQRIINREEPKYSLNDVPPCAHPYEGWSVNGVPIDQFGFLLADFVEGTPPRRGSDVIAARRPGVITVPKVYDARQQTLVLWALKEDPFGSVVGGAERNIDRLKRLFGGGITTVELTRTITLPFQRVSIRRATVELVDALAGRRTALTQEGTYVQFAVDLRFPDPFWYEPENVLAITDDPYGVTLWNPGTVTHHRMVIRVNGPAVNPEVVLEPAGTRVQIARTIGAGEFVELDVDTFAAVDETGTSVAGDIVRDQVFYAQIAPGRNTVLLSEGSGEIRWLPAFL